MRILLTITSLLCVRLRIAELWRSETFVCSQPGGLEAPLLLGSRSLSHFMRRSITADDATRPTLRVACGPFPLQANNNNLLTKCQDTVYKRAPSGAPLVEVQPSIATVHPHSEIGGRQRCAASGFARCRIPVLVGAGTDPDDLAAFGAVSRNSASVVRTNWARSIPTGTRLYEQERRSAALLNPSLRGSCL